MSFWHSELGAITGKSEFMDIPDGTTAIAKIVSFLNKEYDGVPYLQIDWEITSHDFKGRHVFHKLHVFDDIPKRRHRFLNMFMLAYNVFGLSPESDEAPTDKDLKVFVGREAGIKIRLTDPKPDGRRFNWVSEIAPQEGFKCEVGVESIRAPIMPDRIETAFSRQAKQVQEFVDDHLPF